MAVIKHIAIKNSNYAAAYDYLTTKHDEFTGKPILDENGRCIPRDSYFIDGINCTPGSFSEKCEETNAHFKKNTDRKEIKAHHYIISFDPRDRDENGLTPQRAQELGMAFAANYFPGHQVLVCTHPDGHGNAGNIHIHIVLNSVRAYDVDRRDFMERPGDSVAGNKHHVTKDFLEFLKEQTMEMCQHENLNQVDLLAPAKVRITDREYWAQRRGQHEMDEQAAISGKPKTKYQTQNMILRNQIMETMKDSHSFDEFVQKLLANYGIVIQESRGQISYHLSDRTKPIRGKTLGTDFERTAILRFFSIGYRITPDKSIREVTDLSQNAKAQSSPGYAFAIKKENLKQEAKSVAYLLEHGLTLDEMESRYAFASEDFHSQAAALKELESRIKSKKSIQHALNDYYRTKALHKEYTDSKDKKCFRETHPELMIYDAAVKELRAHYGKEKFPSRKQVSEELQALISEKNGVYERYCVARDHYREMQAVRTNYYALQGQEHPAEPEHDQTQNRT